jgi:hypothetical protein
MLKYVKKCFEINMRGNDEPFLYVETDFFKRSNGFSIDEINSIIRLKVGETLKISDIFSTKRIEDKII